MPSWTNFINLALLAFSASTSALEAGQLVPDSPSVLLSTRDVIDSMSNPETGDLQSLMRRACPARCSQYCCVSDGTCIPSLSWSCCGGGIVCGPGRKCCHNGCIDANEECCRTAGRHCNAGYECWLINDSPRCCPRGQCGSSGGSGGSGSRKTITYPPIQTRTLGGGSGFGYYTWTVTWTYRVIFYTSITVRRTTTTTTTSVISFYGSDSADASSSFRAYTATATYDPPASATNPPEPTSGSSGSGGNGGSGTPGTGNDLVAVPPGSSSSVATLRRGVLNWRTALIACTALIPGLLAVYL
ncbi:hypothetical protein GX48_03401 [Paracoccidioides brasiliensis]|nr:hypothetical protein GX48_03401 [Paracoccidioides brasiliensis]